jgi:hypothetical protein
VMDKQFHFSPLLADDSKVDAVAVDVGSPYVFDAEQKRVATTRICGYLNIPYAEDLRGVFATRNRYSSHRPILQVSDGDCPPIVHFSGAHRKPLHRYP